MVTTAILANDLALLYGATFQMRNLDGRGSAISFRILPQPQGWPRAGMEGYVMLGECQHPSRGTVPSILKLFRADLPARQRRSSFLVQLGLAKEHDWLFSGVPYATINRLELQGLTLNGHIARQIVGEDLYRLREVSAWNVDPGTRKLLAGHLCCAVHVLEQMKVVHGDISPRNVIIGKGPDEKPVAVLCDFDGFFHPDEPPLPDEFRGFGSGGYALPVRGPNTFVDTDRFALAALVCEFMAWEPGDIQRYQRSEMLDSKVIERRDVGLLPPEVVARWRPGFDLLQRALGANEKDAMPSPAEWMRVLGVPVPLPRTFAGAPHLLFQRRRGNTAVDFARELDLTSPAGNFEHVDGELRPVEFRMEKGNLSLHFSWDWPVFLRRDGHQHEFGRASRVPVQPGDVVISNQWWIRIWDETPK